MSNLKDKYTDAEWDELELAINARNKAKNKIIKSKNPLPTKKPLKHKL